MSLKNIAYLTSRYPAISHTFILHEIHTLQQLGVEIRAASINAPDRPHSELTQLEQQQAATTFYIKPAGIWGALRAHTAILFSQPKAYLRGLGYALRLGKLDLGKLLYNFFYFVEAVMLGIGCSNNSLNIYMCISGQKSRPWVYLPNRFSQSRFH